jgi:hypothetical protein
MQAKRKVLLGPPRAGFFVGFGEGWIGKSFIRSRKAAETNWWSYSRNHAWFISG